MIKYPSTFVRKVDDVVWLEGASESYVFSAVYTLVLDECWRALFPHNIREAGYWASRKAAEHRVIALKIKRIIHSIPEDLRGNVELLHSHHYTISTRYSAAERACTLP